MRPGRAPSAPRLLAHPAFEPYRALLASLGGGGAFDVAGLNALRKVGAGRFLSSAGAPLRFVRSDDRAKALAYERRILERGEIATREGNLHDLFNGLVWLTFPGMKAAINALHCSDEPVAGGGRGPRRDAATLLDESGIVLVARDIEPIVALARRDWPRFFLECWPRYAQALRLLVVGHALLEKYAEGHCSIVAKTLCLVCPGESPSALAIDRIDRAAAAAMAQIGSPRELPALPLFGVPGWDARTADRGFYVDTGLFRPGGGGAPIAFLAAEGAPRVLLAA